MNKKYFGFRNIESWILVLLLSFISGLLSLLPIALKFFEILKQDPSYQDFTTKIFLELFCAFIIHYIFSLLLLSLGTIGAALWTIYFAGAILASYFFFTFGKNIDPFVVSDILENITGLTMEYLSFKMIFCLLVLLSLFFYLALIATKGRKKYFCKKFIILHLALIATFFIVDKVDELMVKKIRRNYPPVSIIRSILKYNEIKDINDVNKVRISSSQLLEKYKIEYKADNKKPRTVIFVVGESVRSDYFFELLPKYGSKLYNSKNSVFFRDTISCDTITRIAVPCMITNVDHKTPHDFLNSINMIDVFNKLNFNTYWIDNQSLFGYFDATYSSLAKVSDVVIEDKTVNGDKGKYQSHDEVLLPYIAKEMNHKIKDSGDKFILVHLLGSHWHLSQRYPENFTFFNPVCKMEDTKPCSGERLINSYKNSVAYGFDVLNKIVDIFANENAIVFYSSDHGFSLGEGGKIGNAAPEKPFEQISVPTMVWFSDSYKENNPLLIKNLQNKSKSKSSNNITHKNLFHSVIGCSAIKSEFIDKKLNLCQ